MAAIAAVLVGMGVPPAAATDPPAILAPWTGPSPAGLVLDDGAGRRVDLTSRRGRVVLLHFFATWCEPCREELSALARLVARSGDREIAVIAVSVAEPDDRVRRFFEKLPVNYPVLLDRDRAAAKAWGIYALPSTIVLGRDLQPRLVVEQDFDWDKLDLPALFDRVAFDAPGRLAAAMIRQKPITEGRNTR